MFHIASIIVVKEVYKAKGFLEYDRYLKSKFFPRSRKDHSKMLLKLALFLYCKKKKDKIQMKYTGVPFTILLLQCFINS